jgi:hypothetical protein
MSVFKQLRPLYLAVGVVAAALLAFGLWTRPSAQPADAEGFSSARVVEDIKVISQEHHSVAPEHTEARARVREYLAGRLQELGADTLMRFRYDSLQGPENKHVVYTFDVENLLAEFHPLTESEDTTYLMFVAHFDSRYSQPMPEGLVWSYGAADDGYGIGVTLETLSHLLKNRADWKQGVKVLFTDAEEVGMVGMKAQWANDREVFDNVGLMINLEARGPFGPCLLFETCPGNEKLMDLYSQYADYKFTYSLTTVVYTFMPNFTDFTIVKDEIPGLNFSTITDVNHYHTDKDNFSNVTESSIQHYGAQVLPVAMEYVTNPAYADKDYFKSEDDTVNFTVPAMGLFNFSKTEYLVINAVVFLLFFCLFALEGVRGRVKAVKVFKSSAMTLLAAVVSLVAGVLVSYVCCLIAGAKFKPFGVIHGVQFDNVAMVVFTVVLAAVLVLIYIKGRNKAVRASMNSMRSSAMKTAAMNYAGTKLYGTLTLMFVLSAALLIAIGENLMFMVPFTFAAAAMILYRLTSLRFWLLAGIIATLLHAFSFLFALSMALTIGAFGAVMMIASIDLMILIPMADLYMVRE